ncbi:hypothetical protein [Cellulomonas bogoriensis]|uniref:Uncharacterized protein n=1 Tax=Cellulomonas bogoriensis 69B4 = DSM 16987 TaxID=1386082 RepID=A0A0A0BLN5_9CELL|nr:hypothetical protein [Cellulomonas bogoriensis]KGM08740.1 hypothetical protein N869_10075 [Cellulomonas bogoriensis 69B4 = DSM 16987]
MIEAIMLAAGGAAWETVTHAGPYGETGPRLVYRWTWWFWPLGLVSAGTLSATTAEGYMASSVGALVAVGTIITSIRYPYRRVSEDSIKVSRRSVSRDANRCRRLGALSVLSVAFITVLAVIG